MELKGLKCPECGAMITEEIGARKTIFCTYCGNKICVEDNVQRSEHVEKKTININKKTETHYVNEAAVQNEKTNRVSIVVVAVMFISLLLIGAVAMVMSYRYGTKKVVQIPDKSIEVKFQNAILGEASEQMNLIVMEQKLSVVSTIEKQGLFEWGIFKKSKDVIYYGNAIYTVNLGQLRENDIIVDESAKKIKIYVPKPVMYDLTIDPNDFTLKDTQKGLLSFGDIKMTLEEAFYIEENAVSSLEELGKSDDQIVEATEHANNQLMALFGRKVADIDSGYKITIEFY